MLYIHYIIFLTNQPTMATWSTMSTISNYSLWPQFAAHHPLKTWIMWGGGESKVDRKLWMVVKIK